MWCISWKVEGFPLFRTYTVNFQRCSPCWTWQTRRNKVAIVLHNGSFISVDLGGGLCCQHSRAIEQNTHLFLAEAEDGNTVIIWRSGRNDIVDLCDDAGWV